MAFQSYKHFEHVNLPSGTTYRLELQKDWAGTSTEWTGINDLWENEWDKIDRQDPLKEPYQKSRLDIHVKIIDADDLAILEEIFNGDEGDFRLVKKVDGTVVWTGEVISDLLEYDEKQYPYDATISAKDLSKLEGEDYGLQEGREKIIETFASVLPYGLDIHTYTSWDVNGTATDDYLNKIYHDTYALRQYAQTGDEDDQSFTKWRVIEELCRSHKLILRQANGVWNLFHISALDDPTSVTRYVYNSSGTHQSSGSVDASIDADAISFEVLPSTNIYEPAIKSVRVNYNHRTKFSGIKIPGTIVLNSGDSEPTYSQLFKSDGTQYITFGVGYIEVVTSQSSGDLLAQIEVKAGKYNYTKTGGWEESSSLIDIQLENVGPDPDDETKNIWRGAINVQTDLVPADGDGTLSIRFKIPPFVDSIGYYNVGGFEIVNNVIDENDKNSESQSYILTQDASRTFRTDHGVINFGDGPTLYARSALSTDSEGDSLTSENWGRVGQSLDKSFFENYLKEVIDSFRNPRRNLQGNTFGDYEPDKVITYRGLNYFFIGGRQIGRDNRWDLSVIEINIETFDDTLADFPAFASVGEGTLGNTGLVNYIDARLNNRGAIVRTTSDVEGNTTSIPVQQLTEVFFKEGQKAVLVNPFTNQIQTVKISEDQVENDTTLSIESISLDYAPAGSIIQLSSKSATTGILQGQNIVSIFSETNNTGQLIESVDGLVTEINVYLFSSVKKGDDLIVYNVDRGKSYPITVNETITEGDVTLTIEEQYINAPAGSPIKGDDVRKSAELEVSPSGIKQSVESERTASYIGRLSTTITSVDSGITIVELDNVDSSVSVEDNQSVWIEDKNGEGQYLTVNGDQSGSSISSSGLTVDSFDANRTYTAGYAWVGETGWQSSTRITSTRNEIVLKAEETSGEITSLALVKLSASASSGSSILLQADNIKVQGQTTFISALSSEKFTQAGDVQDFAGNGATFQDTPNFPSTRSDGEALQAGDIAFDTDYGRKPYRYNGTTFERAYAIVDGGDIIANTITVREANVDSLLSETATITNTLTLGSSAIIQANSFTPSGVGTGSGIFIGDDSGTYELAVGNGSKYLHYDGTDVLINRGKTVELLNIIGDSGIIKTTENALGTGSGTAEGGVVIDKDGFYAGTSSQTPATANIRILSTGAGEFKGKITATSGELKTLDVLGTLTMGTGGVLITSGFTEGAASGFRLRESDGSIYANNVTVSGAITATSGSITGDLTVTGSIISNNYSAGSAGYKLTSNSAEFASGATIGNLSINPRGGLEDDTTSVLFGIKGNIVTGADGAGLYLNSNNFFSFVSPDIGQATNVWLRVGDGTDYISFENNTWEANLPTTTPSNAGEMYMESDGSGNYTVKIKG